MKLRELAEDEVVSHAGVEHQPLGVAIFVHDGHALAAELPGVERLEPGEHANELALTVAVHSGDADNLAGADAQRRAPQARSSPGLAQLQPHLPRVPRRGRRAPGLRAAHDVQRDRVHRGLVARFERPARHQTAAPQDAHVVGVLAHLVEAMGHHDHGASGVRHASQRGVERLRLARSQQPPWARPG